MENIPIGPALNPDLERELCRIRQFACHHDLSAEQMVEIFEAGIRAATRLKPELFKPPADLLRQSLAQADPPGGLSDAA